MTTTTVKTIGTGGDYTTLQSWEDAAPADLVASDIVWQGQCKNQEFVSSSGLLIISGGTVDSTRYKILTTESGASFADNANKLTNALRYNSSNGAAIRLTGSWARAISMEESYFRIVKLQVADTSNNSGASISANTGGGVTQVVVDSCIAESNYTSAVVLYGALFLKNTLVISGTTSCPYLVVVDNGVSVTNCTFVSPSVPVVSYIRNQYADSVFKNCAFFGGGSTLKTGSGTPTYINCFDDISSPPSGMTQVAYDTSTGSGFESITSGSMDLRIKSTSALKDAGTDTSGSPSYVTTDIVGTARGATYDVGAWEYASANPYPVLSAAGYVPGSITSSAMRPRVTITVP